MFLVLNKEKIIAYLVSILTVCLLFFVANNVSLESKENITQTSVNIDNNYIENNTINNNDIYMNNIAK